MPKKSKYIKVAVDEATLSILSESANGCLAANIETATALWSCCSCKANIRAGKLEICDYCKELDKHD
jgi:hypothetical protein